MLFGLVLLFFIFFFVVVVFVVSYYYFFLPCFKKRQFRVCFNQRRVIWDCMQAHMTRQKYVMCKLSVKRLIDVLPLNFKYQPNSSEDLRTLSKNSNVFENCRVSPKELPEKVQAQN